MEGKILVVDDEESLSRLITYNLEKEGFTVGTAFDGIKAWERIKNEKFDLIILDLMLPGKDGMDICREMRRENIKTPIIMLTARDEEIDKILGLEMGADDYVTKPFSVRELVARTKAHLRRRRDDQDESGGDDNLQVGSFTVMKDKFEIYFKDRLLDLTLKEYELLEILLKNRGRVLKRDYLLQVLWDYSDSVNTRVLDVHISKLRDKIESDTKNPRYIKTVRGLGYKFEENENE